MHGETARLTVPLLMAAIALTSCGGPIDRSTNESAPVVQEQGGSAFHGTLVEPAMDAPTQRLRDTAGQWFSVAAQPANQVTVLFFGYTHCPDVCPTTMADLAPPAGSSPRRCATV